MEAEVEKEKEKEKKNKNLKTSFIIFGVLLFLIAGVMVYLQRIMPEHMFSQGKQYYEAGNYEKAYKMFNMASESDPLNEDMVYYKALTLSKMPPTYNNQKVLYEIAQLDDCEKASDFAEKVLLNMRKAMDMQIGENYIDNVLFEDQLVRWNISKPIKFAITSNITVPEEYKQSFRTAFQNWQTSLNGQIKFTEVANAQDANIHIIFADSVSFGYNQDENIIADSKPFIQDNKLTKVEVKIKAFAVNGNSFTKEQMLPIASHQVGHALGLWGHSADENDVMFYSGDYAMPGKRTDVPTNRDINTLLLIYKMIPDVINEPLSQAEYENMLYHNILTSYPGKNFELEIQRIISELRHNRQNIIAWVDLAINYAYKKNYERSNYILLKVLPLVSSDFANQHVILYNLAANYYKMKDYDTSEKYLSYATNIHDDLDTQILESFIDFRKDRVNIAKEKLELLNKNYPQNIEVALKLAEIYHVKKEKVSEKAVIDRLVRDNPKALKDRRVLKYKANKNKKFVASNK